MISRAKFREQVNTTQRENLYFNQPNLIILIVEQAKMFSPELIPNLISNIENLRIFPEENPSSSSNQEHLIGLIERTLRNKNSPSVSDS